MDRLKPFAKPLFWAALIFAYVAAILPQAEAPQIASNDKVEHMIAFFTLAVLGRIAYAATPWLRTWLLLAGFGALIEFTQLIPVLHRDGNVADWIADMIALSAGILLVTIAARSLGRAA